MAGKDSNRASKAGKRYSARRRMSYEDDQGSRGDDYRPSVTQGWSRTTGAQPSMRNELYITPAGRNAPAERTPRKKSTTRSASPYDRTVEPDPRRAKKGGPTPGLTRDMRPITGARNAHINEVTSGNVPKPRPATTSLPRPSGRRTTAPAKKPAERASSTRTRPSTTAPVSSKRLRAQ